MKLSQTVSRFLSALRYILQYKTVIAIIAAFPFVSAASYLWLNAPNFYGPVHEAYWLGGQIYKLGLPFTGLILYGPGNFSVEDDRWLVPVLDLLFFLQWIVWIHLLNSLKKRLKKMIRR